MPAARSPSWPHRAPGSMRPASTRAWAVTSDQRMTAVLAALSQVGVPYRGYKAIPGYGFDCSGLTSYAWGVAGVSLPHSSSAQIAGATPHDLGRRPAGRPRAVPRPRDAVPRLRPLPSSTRPAPARSSRSGPGAAPAAPAARSVDAGCLGVRLIRSLVTPKLAGRSARRRGKRQRRRVPAEPGSAGGGTAQRGSGERAEPMPSHQAWMGPAPSWSEGALRPVRRAMISAQIEMAVSSGERAPMSRPIGAMIRARSTGSVDAHLGQPLHPLGVGLPRAHHAEVADSVRQRALDGRHVELVVVGEHADGVAWTERRADPLEQAVGPVDDDLVGHREAPLGGEDLPGVAHGDVVAEHLGHPDQRRGEVDGAEDQHAGRRGEGLDEDAARCPRWPRPARRSGARRSARPPARRARHGRRPGRGRGRRGCRAGSSLGPRPAAWPRRPGPRSR